MNMMFFSCLDFHCVLGAKVLSTLIESLCPQLVGHVYPTAHPTEVNDHIW